jgi:hypothetical protein
MFLSAVSVLAVVLPSSEIQEGLTRTDNKFRELVVVTPSPPFKTILELVLWNDLQSCHRITPDVINVINMPSFQYFLYLQEQIKVIRG